MVVVMVIMMMMMMMMMLMMMMIMIIVGEIYELNVTARSGRTSVCLPLTSRATRGNL